MIKLWLEKPKKSPIFGQHVVIPALIFGRGNHYERFQNFIPFMMMFGIILNLKETKVKEKNPIEG